MREKKEGKEGGADGRRGTVEAGKGRGTIAEGRAKER